MLLPLLNKNSKIAYVPRILDIWLTIIGIPGTVSIGLVVSGLGLTPLSPLERRGLIMPNVIMIFIPVLLSLVSRSQAEDEDVLYYEDLQSQELRDQFDQAPLISQSLTQSDWCRVITYLAIAIRYLLLPCLLAFGWIRFRQADSYSTTYDDEVISRENP